MKVEPDDVVMSLCPGCGDQFTTLGNPVCAPCTENGYTAGFFVERGYLMLGPNLVDPNYVKIPFVKIMLKQGSWYALASFIATAVAIALGSERISGALSIVFNLAITLPLAMALIYALSALECAFSVRKLIEGLGLSRSTGLNCCPSCAGKLAFGGEVCATCVAAGVTFADLDSKRFIVVGDRLRDLHNLRRQMLSGQTLDLLKGLLLFALSYFAWLFLQGDTLVGQVSNLLIWSTLGMVGQVSLSMLLTLSRTGCIRKIRKSVAN